MKMQKNEIQKNKNYSKIFSITLITILTISSIAAVLPTVLAHDPPWEIPTWAFMSISPDPIGVNQEALIVMWINDYPITANGAYGDRWQGYTIDVTKPDGTKITLGPYASDPVGAQFTQFTPTEIGEYTLVFSWPGYTIVNANPNPDGSVSGGAFINDTYTGATSDPVTLMVTEEQVEPYYETPIPEGYWTRPISAINRNWASVGGSWLNAGDTPGDFQQYSDGPGSAHVMWTIPYWEGGIMGGQAGSTSYYTGRSYETFGNGMIVLNGKLYYNVLAPPRFGWYCVDLRTGEEMYFHNTTGPISLITGGFGFDFSGDIDTEALSFGQIYNYDSPNQHGGFPYLWSVDGPEPNTWMMFDGFTGNYICSIANVSSGGTAVYGKDGSILRYQLSTSQDYLRVWNTSRAIWYEENFSSNYYWVWRPDLGATFDGNNGYSLNVSIPADLTGSIRAVVEDEYVLVSSNGQNDKDGNEPGVMTALSLVPGNEGTVLWTRGFSRPYNIIGGTGGGGVFGYGSVAGPTVDVANNVFYFESQLEKKIWVYDLNSMQLLWESDPGPNFNFYNMYQSVAYGKIFNYGMGGVVEAYDIRTGEYLWNYTSGTLGFETAYENTPLQLGAIADEKLYMFSDEHSPTMPLARGRGLRCIDVNTGEKLWEIHHWGIDFALADGYLVGLNVYDNQIYCYGKGPSATTVAVKNDVITEGSSIMITGTVTDQSAGAMGTPAIADEYMGEWMEYIYMNRPMPEVAVGVTVKLSTYDPNGNYQDIGTTTVDTSGNFGMSWMPPVPGDYYIMAEFEGSEAYGGSVNTAYLSVAEAPEATPPPPDPTPPPPTETYIAGSTIAILAGIAVAVFLILRKK